MYNVDLDTIDGFGRQWTDFDQSGAPFAELATIFEKYFDHFPWAMITDRAVGLDAGCGTGRWAQFVAPRVGKLICVDASSGAIEVARKKLASLRNCEFYDCTLEELPVPDNSLDFAYCLGVLHYVPDPAMALRGIVRKLKPGAPLLIYVYYALDQRGPLFRGIWRMADIVRRQVARMPYPVRRSISDAIAAGVYYPLARTSALIERFGFRPDGIPLSAYRRRSFYTMRTDCLDRFGNRLEHRFTRNQIADLLRMTGLTNIVIPADEPYWRAVAVRGAARLSQGL